MSLVTHFDSIFKGLNYWPFFITIKHPGNTFETSILKIKHSDGICTFSLHDSDNIIDLEYCIQVLETQADFEEHIHLYWNESIEWDISFCTRGVYGTIYEDSTISTFASSRCLELGPWSKEGQALQCITRGVFRYYSEPQKYTEDSGLTWVLVNPHAPEFSLNCMFENIVHDSHTERCVVLSPICEDLQFCIDETYFKALHDFVKSKERVVLLGWDAGAWFVNNFAAWDTTLENINYFGILSNSQMLYTNNWRIKDIGCDLGKMYTEFYQLETDEPDRLDELFVPKHINNIISKNIHLIIGKNDTQDPHLQHSVWALQGEDRVSRNVWYKAHIDHFYPSHKTTLHVIPEIGFDIYNVLTFISKKKIL